MFVDLNTFLNSNREKLGGDKFEKVGSVTWYGTKRLISFDSTKGWGVIDAHWLMRFLRWFFGSYRETHLSVIFNELTKIRERIRIEFDSPEQPVVSQPEPQPRSWYARIFSYPPPPPPTTTTTVSPPHTVERERPYFPDALMRKITDNWNKTYPSAKNSVRMGELRMTATQTRHNIQHDGKRRAYSRVTRGENNHTRLNDVIYYKKRRLSENEGLKNSFLFLNKPKPRSDGIPGWFTYPPQDGDLVHWMANFVGQRLFALCNGPELGLEELQVLEHPGLYHLKAALDIRDPLGTFRVGEIALISGAKRYGILDPSKEVFDPVGRDAQGTSLYGHNFSLAREGEINAGVDIVERPRESNIFVMAAPDVARVDLRDSAYKKQHLEQLFYTAYLAFSSIKSENMESAIAIHTGNWGCGACGNDPKTVALIQLAAARFSGIYEVHYHFNSTDNTQPFRDAKNLLDRIERDNPLMTIDEFLTHLERNARDYDLVYRINDT